MSTSAAKALPAQPIRLYRRPSPAIRTGWSLFLSLLGLPFETHRDRPGRQRGTRRPAFLAMNAFGQVPVIQDGDVTLADSNAILVYLNARYALDAEQWLPRDPLAAAPVQRWLSVARRASGLRARLRRA